MGGAKFTAGAGTRHQRKHSSGISSHLHDALDAATLLRERCGRILTVGCDSPCVFSPHSASPITLVHTDLFPSPSTASYQLYGCESLPCRTTFSNDSVSLSLVSLCSFSSLFCLLVLIFGNLSIPHLFGSWAHGHARAAGVLL